MNKYSGNITFSVIPALIWGSTWYAIKFQIGNVAPILSVAYRFLLAGIIMMILMFSLRKNMRFSAKDHLLFVIQGTLLFGLNYWLVYMAEQVLTSGLVSVIFSLIIFFNIIFGRIILKNRIAPQVIVGGMVAIFGTYLLFSKEIAADIEKTAVLQSLLFCLLGVVSASLGNVMSAYIQRRKLPVLQVNAYGMLYGSIIILLISMMLQIEFTFESSSSYILSLVYLSVFGSIVAFGTYLTVIGRIGPEKAAYILVIIPVISMVISSIFEDYTWNLSAIIGLPFLLLGNYLGMSKKQIIKISINGNRKNSTEG